MGESRKMEEGRVCKESAEGLEHEEEEEESCCRCCSWQRRTFTTLTSTATAAVSHHQTPPSYTHTRLDPTLFLSLPHPLGSRSLVARQNVHRSRSGSCAITRGGCWHSSCVTPVQSRKRWKSNTSSSSSSSRKKKN